MNVHTLIQCISEAEAAQRQHECTYTGIILYYEIVNITKIMKI